MAARETPPRRAGAGEGRSRSRSGAERPAGAAPPSAGPQRNAGTGGEPGAAPPGPGEAREGAHGEPPGVAAPRGTRGGAHRGGQRVRERVAQRVAHWVTSQVTHRVTLRDSDQVTQWVTHGVILEVTCRATRWSPPWPHIGSPPGSPSRWVGPPSKSTTGSCSGSRMVLHTRSPTWLPTGFPTRSHSAPTALHIGSHPGSLTRSHLGTATRSPTGPQPHAHSCPYPDGDTLWGLLGLTVLQEPHCICRLSCGAAGKDRARAPPATVTQPLSVDVLPADRGAGKPGLSQHGVWL